MSVDEHPPAALPPQVAFFLAVGLWGLLLYREHTGKAALAWVVAATFTVAMVIKLTFEKLHR